GYADGLDADPARLDVAQQRLARLTALTRKYAPDVDGVIAWADQSRERLSTLDGDDDRVAELSATHERLLDELAAAAAALSTARRAAARRLGTAATAELAALAMPHARLEVVVRQRDDPGGLFVRGLDGGDRRVAFG